MNVSMKLFRSKNRLVSTFLPDYSARQARELFFTPRKFPAKPWEEKMEQKGRRIQLGGGLSAIVWGGSNRKVLVVHGWESRATQLSGFVDVLVNQGFEVVALDGPAHGASSGERANPWLFSQAVSQAIQAVGPFEAILGHSMGGNAVATALAQGVECSKVVLISSPSSVREVLERFAGFIGLSPASTVRFLARVEEEVGVTAESLNTVENIRRSSARGLVIHDEADAEIPFQNALDIVNNWPGAQLFSTQGFGHRAIVRQPGVWQKVAAFLA